MDRPFTYETPAGRHTRIPSGMRLPVITLEAFGLGVLYDALPQATDNTFKTVGSLALLALGADIFRHVRLQRRDSRIDAMNEIAAANSDAVHEHFQEVVQALGLDNRGEV